MERSPVVEKYGRMTTLLSAGIAFDAEVGAGRGAVDLSPLSICKTKVNELNAHSNLQKRMNSAPRRVHGLMEGCVAVSGVNTRIDSKPTGLCLHTH